MMLYEEFEEIKMRSACSLNPMASWQPLVLSLIMVIMVSLGCAQSWTPDAAIISKVELGIRLSDIPPQYSPENPPIIAQYARYYVGYKANNHRMISGEFVLSMGSKSKPAGIYIVSSKIEFPTIFDGGCSVLHIIYDVDEAHLVSLKCNGFA